MIERLLGLWHSAGERYDLALGLALGVTLAVVLLHLLALGVTRRFGPRRSRGNRAATALVLAVLLACLALAATALAGSARAAAAPGSGLRGVLLFAHVGVGAAFLVGLALLAVLRSAASRPGRARDRFGPLAKVTFWLVLVTGACTGATMLLATFPWFGAEDLERLLDLHRRSGLALAVAALLHAHGLLLGRLGPRPDADLARSARRADTAAP
ncbi:MAG: hypothetical protein IPM29_25725 [Planctomycetes bacterium]|nr:hypothetical protein [Planctomycetota bacterium]